MPDKEKRVYTWWPKQIAGYAPVEWSVSRPGVVRKFRRVLRDAKDEKPLQLFFEENPIALVTGLLRPHTVWAIPRPSFPLPQGGGCVPDFVLCEWSSIGPKWILVELESPTKSPVTTTGVAAICYHAAEQINHWRTYLGREALYLNNKGWHEITNECEGVIIIGRRDDTNREKLKPKLHDFRRQRIDIASYDRILELFERTQRYIAANEATIASIFKKRPLRP